MIPRWQDKMAEQRARSAEAESMDGWVPKEDLIADEIAALRKENQELKAARDEFALRPQELEEITYDLIPSVRQKFEARMDEDFYIRVGDGKLGVCNQREYTNQVTALLWRFFKYGIMSTRKGQS